VLLLAAALVLIQGRRTTAASADLARGSAQAAADAAALAGAASFLDQHDNASLARAAALESIRLNDALQNDVRLNAGTISIDLRNGTIEVEVIATPKLLPKPLQRVLGIREPTVTVTAAAEAMDARCEDAGMNSEGIPTVRCEGMIKYLKLIGEER
jgi:hypothetical protein